MLDKNKLTSVVEDAIAGTNLFIVDITVSPDNRVEVTLDSPKGMDTDTCAAISRKIEAEFDRDHEDYELEVGSAGLTAPFKVRAQYMKNLGNDVDVLTRDGRKLHGVLAAVGDDDFTVEVPTKVKPEGAKRPVIQNVPTTLRYDQVKQVTYAIKF